ncbi:hypothetical protein [Escherichia phage vB-Eco-KMB37]|nr:hypothetical protein [Escherichia phage vB-Eco-KMB37]
MQSPYLTVKLVTIVFRRFRLYLKIIQKGVDKRKKVCYPNPRKTPSAARGVLSNLVIHDLTDN